MDNDLNFINACRKHCAAGVRPSAEEGQRLIAIIDALRQELSFLYDHDGECLGDHADWMARIKKLIDGIGDDAHLLAVMPDMIAALTKAEEADHLHANCDECEGLGAPEACGECFPLADDARLMRRAVLAKIDPLAFTSPDRERT